LPIDNIDEHRFRSADLKTPYAMNDGHIFLTR